LAFLRGLFVECFQTEMLLVDSGTPELILQILKVHLLIWKEAFGLFERGDLPAITNGNATYQPW
jgi:hypothetical protein